VVEWNKAHPDLEMIPTREDQSLLERMADPPTQTAEWTKTRDSFFDLCRELYDEPIKRHELDLLVAPCTLWDRFSASAYVSGCELSDSVENRNQRISGMRRADGCPPRQHQGDYLDPFRGREYGASAGRQVASSLSHTSDIRLSRQQAVRAQLHRPQVRRRQGSLVCAQLRSGSSGPEHAETLCVLCHSTKRVQRRPSDAAATAKTQLKDVK
jgi:hypothetical protein